MERISSGQNIRATEQKVIEQNKSVRTEQAKTESSVRESQKRGRDYTVSISQQAQEKAANDKQQSQTVERTNEMRRTEQQTLSRNSQKAISSYQAVFSS